MTDAGDAGAGPSVEAPLPPLIARDDEVDQVLAMLSDTDGRLVSITGRSGVGKTRLAVEVARVLNEQRADACVFVALAGVREPDLVVDAIAASAGAGELPGSTAFDVLAHALLGREQVLVLDNFEHLVAAANDLPRLLAACPDLRLLVTTQARLNLRAERTLRLRGLNAPPVEEHDVARIAAEPAVALYCDRAAAVDASFRLDQGNALDVASLCRELEGLPLAIELAAARAVMLPPAVMLSRLSRAGLDVLRADRRDAPERHHALRSAIEWTYGLLTPNAQRLLRDLSVTNGAFDLDDAEAIGGDASFDALGALVDFHLVDPISDDSRIEFRIPMSIAELAHERLVAAGEADHAEDTWLGWYATRARRVAVAMDTDEQPAARRWVAAHHESLVAALSKCIERNDPARAVELLCALLTHWLFTGLPAACGRMLTRTFDLAAEAGLATSAYAEALAGSTSFTWWDASDAARRSTQARLELAETLVSAREDARAELHVVAALARTSAMARDYERSERAVRQGLTIADSLGSETWTGRFEIWAGMLAHQQGNVTDAITLGVAGHERVRRTNDERMIVAAFMLLYPLREQLPRGGDELPPPDEVLDLARLTGQTQLLLAALPMFALAAVAAGDMTVAAQRCGEALRMIGVRPSSQFAVYSLMAAAQIAHANGDNERAARYHGTVRAHIPFLAASMPPASVLQHEQVVARIERELGSDMFTTANAAGEAADRRAALEEAVAWVESLVAPAPSTSLPPRRDLPGRRNDGALSNRQLEVLRLVASGLSNKEIALELGVSTKTVEHHAEAIFRKLRVRGRTEATAWAHRHGVIDG